MPGPEVFFTAWWLQLQKGIIQLNKISFPSLAEKKRFKATALVAETPMLFLSSKSELAVAANPDNARQIPEMKIFHLLFPDFTEPA
jgi:hypothetical protein